MNINMRRVTSIASAFIVAMLVEYYFSLAHDFLIPLTTVFVMLTSVGNLVYQSTKRFLLVVIVISLLSWFFPPYHMLYMRLGDVCLGAIIGILANLFILPRKPDKEFRSALLPILKDYEHYFLGIIELVLDKEKNNIDQRKIELEKQLQVLPSWVFETGFDAGLQKGHQYFLMKINQVAEILFAMHHIARWSFDEELIEGIKEPLLICANRASRFFEALYTVLELKKLTEGVEDFEAEIIQLDNKFQTLVPANIELFDMSSDDIFFYEFIYDLKDLRNALVKLGLALR